MAFLPPPPNQSYFNSPITSSSSPFVPISSTNFTLKAQPVSNGQPVVTSENSPKTILEISSNQQNPEIRSNQQQCIVSPNPMFMYYPDSFQNHR